MRRIYFVGGHSTGKTTLTRHFSQSLGLPMITEVARAVLAEMEIPLSVLRTDLNLVAEYQKRVFKRQMEVEREHEGGFVSDRAFDNLAYAAEHTKVLPSLLKIKGFGDYMKWVSEGLVFFVRPKRELLTADGTREPPDWDGLVRIDGMIKLLLEQFEVPYLPIDTVSMQERVTSVEYVLKHR